MEKDAVNLDAKIIVCCWITSDSPLNYPLLYCGTQWVTELPKRHGAENSLPSLKMMQNYVYSPACYKAVEEETFSL